MNNTIQHFIDGKFTSGNSTRAGKIYNPAKAIGSIKKMLARSYLLN